MGKTWLTYLLPKDEYREQRLLYFIAEAAVILVALLFIYLGINTLVSDLHFSGEMIGLLCFTFLVTYITIRSISSGIEYPEVATKTRFKQENRAKIFSSIIFGVIFLLIQIAFKGFPTNGAEIFDVVPITVLSALFFYLFQYISLRRSFKKNKELMDD